MSIIISLILVGFIILVYHYYVHYGKNGRLINSIPGPTTIPIMGNALLLQDKIENVWKSLIMWSDKYYSIYKLWLIFTPVVFVRHPDDLKVILSNKNCIEKSFLYDPFRPWLRTGVFTSGGAKWHFRRKILTSAFHFNILQEFVEIFIEESNRMTQSLKDLKVEGMVEGTIQDLLSFVSKHTLNAICETTMGTSLQSLGTFEREYREAVHQITEIIIYRITRPWLHSDIIFGLFPKGRLQKRMLKILHGFSEKIIAERKLYHKCINGQHLKSLENGREKVEDNDAEIIGKKKRLALLDLLIATSREGCLSDVDIGEEVDTFIFGGHDTTAISIVYALLLLAEHKDIQDRIRTEVVAELQENGEKYTIKLLQNLPYLDRCIKEILRLYPSAPAISRMATEDIKLQSYLIPAGTCLFLNIFHVHRDPNFWPNPDVFDPDRFLPENCKNRHHYSYIPFSAGFRNCIGQRLALLKLKAMIALLVQNFYLEPIDYLKDIPTKPEVILRPAHPVRIKFVPIEGTAKK